MTLHSASVGPNCVVYRCENPALDPEHGRVRCVSHESASSILRLTSVLDEPDDAVDLERVRALVRQLAAELGL